MGGSQSSQKPTVNYLSRQQADQAYIDQAELDAYLKDYATQKYLQDYYTKTAADAATLNALQAYQPKGNYALKTDIPSLSNYALTSDLSKYQPKGNYLSADALNSGLTMNQWGIIPSKTELCFRVGKKTVGCIDLDGNYERKIQRFVGAGITSGTFFDITITNTDDRTRMEYPNDVVGKKIRIWYNDSGFPVGLALSVDWVYNNRFNRDGITANNLVNFSSDGRKLLIYDKMYDDLDPPPKSIGFEFPELVGSGAIPFHNANSAVNWIVNNKPSNIGIRYDADTGYTYLGFVDMNGNVKFGQGDLTTI
jgi:hypothetical protein